MFLRFAISNYCSIHESQALSFVASSLKDRDDGLIECTAAPSGSIIPAIVIYGPNASGKTSLVTAIQFAQGAILHSHAKGDSKGGVPRQPFKLDPRAASEPTRCEIDFVLNGMRHHYGFTATSEEFESEWLYYFPSSHRRRLFEREGGQFLFGRDLGGHNTVISNLTRPNSLFVSTAAQNRHAYLSKVVDLFRSIRFVRNVDVPGAAAISKLNEEGGMDGRVIAFLRNAGTGVVNYKRHEVETSETERLIGREVFDLFRRITDLGDELPDPQDTKVIYELTHRASDGELVPLDLNEESAGTRRLLLVLGEAYRAIDHGSLLVVDELDASLHTHVCEAVLRIFCHAAHNPLGAQLVATTHDTNVMSRSIGQPEGLLRRDEIWFVGKSDVGATEVYPLTDFSSRKDDNFERGYLEGRFGAVPFDDPEVERGEAG